MALTLAFAWALVDWRRGVYACLVFDVVRDPIRKLSEGQSVTVTVVAAALWLFVFLGATFSLGPRLFTLGQRFSCLRNVFILDLLELSQGACVSLVTLPSGWQVAAIGFASYLLPVMAVVVGYHFLLQINTMWRVMRFYCLVNGLALSGSLFEFLKIKSQALGGIKMIWLRYEPGYVVQLISGFYRSPDVMGLHAANVAMFATLLAVQRKSRYRLLWIGLLLWSSWCLLISGRRKMIGMLLVFAATYVGLRFRHSGFSRGLLFLVLLTTVSGGFYYLIAREEGLREYVQYAGTTVSDSVERFNTNVVGGVLGTLEQAGVWGNGLGTGTQGAYYTSSTLRVHNWQEDGVSRILAEMGLIGAILVLVAVARVVQACIQALKNVPFNNPVQDLQIGLAAVIAASVASFVVSHQAFSGDPCAILFVSFLLGVFLSGPAQVSRQRIAATRILTSNGREAWQRPVHA
ncbi:MAG: hypothetical protein ACLPWF_27430 [Bryobacteraceae bacterium]